MANILDYLKWRGDLTFLASPFNEIDNLILAQIVYLEFNGIVPDIDRREYIRLSDAASLFFKKNSKESLKKLPKLQQDVASLLQLMAVSKRFCNCRLSRYVNEIDKKAESQFSAIKIELDDHSVYISFSGTDNSVAGWKENFNMSFLNVTPAQAKAVKYVEQIVPFYKNKLRFGGHSKGGNLAVYAAMYAKKSIQNRLLDIFNNDGPGFMQAMISEEGYQLILPKIHTILPQSSIIGMLLEHEEAIDIIESSNKGIFQHDPFSWQLEGTSFFHADQLTTDSIFMDQTLTTWINSMDDEQRHQFVDTFFSILEKAGIENTDDLEKMKFQTFLTLLNAMNELSSENRDVLLTTLKLLLEIGSKNILKKS